MVGFPGKAVLDGISYAILGRWHLVHHAVCTLRAPKRRLQTLSPFARIIFVSDVKFELLINSDYQSASLGSQ